MYSALSKEDIYIRIRMLSGETMVYCPFDEEDTIWDIIVALEKFLHTKSQFISLVEDREDDEKKEEYPYDRKLIDCGKNFFVSLTPDIVKIFDEEYAHEDFENDEIVYDFTNFSDKIDDYFTEKLEAIRHGDFSLGRDISIVFSSSHPQIEDLLVTVLQVMLRYEMDEKFGMMDQPSYNVKKIEILGDVSNITEETLKMIQEWIDHYHYDLEQNPINFLYKYE